MTVYEWLLADALYNCIHCLQLVGLLDAFSSGRELAAQGRAHKTVSATAEPKKEVKSSPASSEPVMSRRHKVLEYSLAG
jgi:hypothetical protein